MNKKSFWKSRKVIGGLLGPLVLLAVLPAPANAYQRPGRLLLVTVGHDGQPATFPQPGPAPGAGFASWVDMSADGRFVAFDSALSNLVEGDINRDSDIFVRDMVSGVTELVSVSSTGVQGLGASQRPRISADGRYVAFQSDSSNLVAGDTNGETDVFVHDRQTGKTERVSVTTGGAQAVGGWSEKPAISTDGRYVAFATLARNIVPTGASNLCEEIVVHDRITGVTEHASPTAGGGASNGICTYGSFLDLSADGRFVTFETQMHDLVPDDHNASWDIFVRDLQQKTTRRVSVASDGSEANHNSYNPRISADGRFVAFTSCASNLVPEDNNSSGLKAAGGILGTGDCFDVFVHDLLTGATERVSVSSSGREGDHQSYWMDISGDGRFVAFSSSATTLAPGASDYASRVFVHDRRTRQTEIVSVRDEGTVFGNSAYFSPPAISSDGRYVAFSKPVDFSIAGRYEKMVYVRDRGPAIGVGGLTAAVLTDTPPSVSGSGWAGLGGTTVTEATDPPDDVSPPEAARIGGEFTGAALFYRPEEEDLLVRFSLAHIPTSSSSVVGSGYGVPGIAGLAGILHTLFFTVDGQRWEVRASRVNVDEPGYPPPPSISLWRCAPSCQETMHMNGAYGSTGAEIVGRFTLANISAAEGAAVTSVLATAAVGDLVLDEVQLPAGTIPVSEVRLALAPAGSEPTGYGPKLALSSGSFSGSVSAEDLPPGVYELWARACVGAACDVRSTHVTLGSPGDPTPPPISPWPSASPTLSPAPSASPTDAGSARGTYPTEPDDPYFDSPEDFLFGLAQSGIQWGPQKINAPQAWQEDQATGHRVKVAVLDTGVDLTHPDLTCPGKLEVVTGSDVVDHDSNPDDEFGHGTHVAGIIGACTNNGVGIAGVAPDAVIMPIRVLDENGSGTDAQLIAGLDKAVEFGVHVINISLGYPPGKDIVNDVSAIDAAIAHARAAGIVIVAAAGNDSSPLCDYPALADDIICVGATDPRDLKSWYSTFPNKIDNDNDIGPGVVAPGGAGTVFCDLDSEEILSLYAVDIDEAEGDCDGRLGYTDLAGTSMAAPHVAGIAALVYDRLGGVRSPDNAQKVIDAITSTAVDLGPQRGYDPVYGSGRVDALAAVCAVGPNCDDVEPSPTPTETASPTPTETATASPSPTETSSASPSPSPSESPQPSLTDVSFTENSAGSGQHSDQTLFEALLSDSSGGPIEGRELSFELRGSDSTRSFTATTNDDGVAAVTPMLEEKPGPYQLTVRFTGDVDHAGDADTMSFLVDKEDADLALTVEGNGNNKTLSARLSDLDTSSERIAERTIDFYSDGELIGSDVTNGNGVASVAVPPAHRGNNRSYEAVFEGDDFYLGASDERPGKGGKGGKGGGGGGRGAQAAYAGKVFLM